MKNAIVTCIGEGGLSPFTLGKQYKVDHNGILIDDNRNKVSVEYYKSIEHLNLIFSAQFEKIQSPKELLIELAKNNFIVVEDKTPDKGILINDIIWFMYGNIHLDKYRDDLTHVLSPNNDGDFSYDIQKVFIVLKYDGTGLAGLLDRCNINLSVKWSRNKRIEI